MARAQRAGEVFIGWSQKRGAQDHGQRLFHSRQSRTVLCLRGVVGRSVGFLYIDLDEVRTAKGQALSSLPSIELQSLSWSSWLKVPTCEPLRLLQTLVKAVPSPIQAVLTDNVLLKLVVGVVEGMVDSGFFDGRFNRFDVRQTEQTLGLTISTRSHSIQSIRCRDQSPGSDFPFQN
jgi:hypothetical protein